MCGILSMSLFGKQAKKERAKRVSIASFLFTETLRASKPRGKDATGVLSVFEDDWYVLKQPVDSERFVVGDEQNETGEGQCSKASLEDLMNVWYSKPGKFRNALGHVRAGTKGSEYEHENNHPIVIQHGGSNKCIVGIHNGIINNDTSLFTKHDMKRLGKVDSEVIFQLLYKFAEPDGTITSKGLEKTYDELSGSFAFLAVSMDEPEVIVGAVNAGRPCDVFFIPEIQAGVLVSDGTYLNKALNVYKRAKVRGEFDRDLTTDEYTKSLSKHVFSIDVRKDIKSSKELFSSMEKVEEYTSHTTYWRNYSSSNWPYTSNSKSDTDKKEKEEQPENKTAIIKYGGIPCGMENEVSSVENEDNFSPAPAIDVRTDGDKDDDDSTDEICYAEVEVVSEVTPVEEDEDTDCFAHNMSYEDLENEGKELLAKIIAGSSDNFYDSVVNKISWVSGGDESSIQNIVDMTGLEELSMNAYAQSFGEGYAIGFRDGALMEEWNQENGRDENIISLSKYLEDLRSEKDKVYRKVHRQSEALMKMHDLISALLPKRKSGKTNLSELKKMVGDRINQVSLIGAMKIVNAIDTSKKGKEKEK